MEGTVTGGKPCHDCGLSDPAEQEARRKPPMEGLCGPGRCVVNRTVWLTWDDGEPLGFQTQVEKDAIHALQRAGLGHLAPDPGDE